MAKPSLAQDPGTMIYQTFQEATKARRARKVKIVNLGLEPWEAVAMGLEAESIPAEDRRRAVAEYACNHPGNFGDEQIPVANWTSDWEEWLQTHRVELNAMTTPQFIEWLDGKMEGYSKLVPPEDVIGKELDERIETKIREAIEERILRESNIDAQVVNAIAAIEKPSAAALADGIRELFDSEPESEWRDHIEAVARDLTEPPP